MTIATNSAPAISGDQALSIAHADAAKVYENLARYRIQIVLEDDGWHVDYQIKEIGICGGGPHYVIDGVSGAIISKRYEQLPTAPERTS